MSRPSSSRALVTSAPDTRRLPGTPTPASSRLPPMLRRWMPSEDIAVRLAAALDAEDGD